MILRHGLNNVLNWQHIEKPIRIGRLTEFLKGQQIETEHELSGWLMDDTNVDALRKLNGIGPKTVDYLKSLVGLQAVAVDRHVKTFVKWAGVDASTYDEIRELVSKAADSLEVKRQAFDHAIWSYVSSSQKRAA
jgi:endonuclease III